MCYYKIYLGPIQNTKIQSWNYFFYNKLYNKTSRHIKTSTP